MRCNRCDGLAVPQAVALDPDGQVVFGWCLNCLTETECQLVEVPSSGPRAIELSVLAPPSSREPMPPGNSPPRGLDQRRRTVTVVASFMIGWGLILLAAAFITGSRPATGASPLGNGTAPLLGVGGTATAILGLGLLGLASRRK